MYVLLLLELRLRTLSLYRDKERHVCYAEKTLFHLHCILRPPVIHAVL